MKFEYQIQEKEFIKLKFFLAYRKPLSIILLFVSILVTLLYVIKILKYEATFELVPIFLFTYVLIFGPIFNYFRFKKEYQSSKPLQSKVISEINEEKIMDITGDSKAETSWNNVHKIEETKDWFLFYYSNNLFGLSPKRAMTNEQISEFRNIVKTKGINAILK